MKIIIKENRKQQTVKIFKQYFGFIRKQIGPGNPDDSFVGHGGMTTTFRSSNYIKPTSFSEAINWVSSQNWR